MIDKTHEQLSITEQCELANLSKSTLYYKPRAEKPENVALMNQIDELYTRHPFYGARRIQKTLSTAEKRINIKRIRRLMKKMGLLAIYPKRDLSRPAPLHKKYPYLLRGLAIERCNQVWSTDITYVKMNRGYMYLIAVIDWHSRFVLSWKISNTMTVDFCRECLQEAIDHYGTPEIFNTDQGSQFTSPAFISIWDKQPEVKISMDGKGRATDNACIERLWRSVKQENIYASHYQDGASLWAGLYDYFTFYNNERIHQSLNYKTPHEIYNTKQSLPLNKKTELSEPTFSVQTMGDITVLLKLINVAIME